ncbi:DUF177 domain-containing protein [Acetobacter orleanensis]|uniref:DUF177 domain-containing protein n=1 Tax=Acetobacter orleanensis TaxID=104099 RepID=A0A4Y3TMH9_9PROT|nr:DUF177 domain-containing protein [Acetobacter orleanensis]KXV64325.1 hypothetical protein AD949_06065 [Acetobacter orleanensis]PCD79149.1 hypothetical protein CO710_08590 [Acetobacter orleanensis]GAN69412.1 hypothetical protein Abol_034_039 [Acetobacter orleanensis JCM 7639]GBR22451.1 hypothetical protein AA0473_0126 [Acetobacter orleanensis NRIC 0473]GEB82984.1 hypothetical protein AOR01nite_14610 [Acetobacter orleanensis]
MPHKPEFSRPVAVRRIGAAGLDLMVEATPAECRQVAERLGLPEISMFRCKYTLSLGRRDIVSAHGALAVRFKQTCVRTLEPFEDMLAGSFVVEFVPEEHFEEKAVPDLEAVDEIPYAGESIDLGEAAVEQFALDLEPYPHAPDASLPAGLVISEEEAEKLAEQDAAEKKMNPFADLARLRRKDS